MIHWEKKWSHFDLKSWATGGTKIRPGILSNLTQLFSNDSESRVEFYFPSDSIFLGQNHSIIRSKWLHLLGQNDSIYWVNMTQFFSSKWLNFLGQNDSIF